MHTVASRVTKQENNRDQYRDYVFVVAVDLMGSYYVGGTNLLSQSSSLDPPPDDVGEGRSDGDVTDDVTLRKTNTSRPLSFRQTLPTDSWDEKTNTLI